MAIKMLFVIVIMELHLDFEHDAARHVTVDMELMSVW
jgi:hypothetical protein